VSIIGLRTGHISAYIVVQTFTEIIDIFHYSLDSKLSQKLLLGIALNNIILNGIQAIVSTGTIIISVEENNDEIVIQVEDSGEPIPKEDLDHIFEPLFTTKQHGTGLGLSSVKSIIEAHGGTISATSSPVIFTIKLPKNL